ncbi:hypothetical protein EJ02DRAFT_361634, partial [Clathrospora elynae]
VTPPADMLDLMFYITAWADTVHRHHSLEESLSFPQTEEFAQEAGQVYDMGVYGEEREVL